jgi:hypothetical protein
MVLNTKLEPIDQVPIVTIFNIQTQMTTHAPGKKTFLFHMILGSYINVYTFIYKTLMYCGGGAFKGEF